MLKQRNDSPMFCPYETDTYRDAKSSRLQIHPRGATARRFIRGFLELDDSGRWIFIPYERNR